MTTLLGVALLAVFAGGVAATLLREGWQRRAGVVVILVTAVGALWAALGPAAAWWAIGPVLAVLVLGPTPARPRLSFDLLARRATVIGVLLVLATLVAVQFELAGVPRPLAAILWDTGALGVGWLMVPIDSHERSAGTVLAIAAGGALLLVGSAAGGLTIFLTGALAAIAVVPMAGLSRGLDLAFGALILGTAALLLLGPPASISFIDLSLALRPPRLLAMTVLLIAAWARPPDRRSLAAVPAGLMLLATTAGLGWAALAAATTLLTDDDRDRRLVWAGLALLGATSVLGAALDPAPRLRLVLAGLVGGWVLLAVAPGAAGLRLTIATLFMLVQASSSTVLSGAPRFQLLAAITAAALLVAALVSPQDRRWRGSAGLALLALSTGSGTGTLAAILLILDAILIDATRVGGGGPWSQLRSLARSGWPPTVAFAGRTLAVVAAVDASPLLGGLALALVVALLLVPLLEPRPAPATLPVDRKGIVLAGLSLAAGLAPSWVARLGHL